MVERLARAAEIIADATKPEHQWQNKKRSAHPKLPFRLPNAGESPACKKSGPGPTTAAAARCRSLFRSTVAAGFFSVPLDPDNGKDQHGRCRLTRG
jgi:hypothetical protein